MIRVVDVRGLPTREQRAGVVYVGRAFAGWPAHPLGNPFRIKSLPSSRAACLARYRDWLRARPTLDADLEALWEATGHGAKPLGCWCIDATTESGGATVCHAQILAALLADRFEAKGGAT